MSEFDPNAYRRWAPRSQERAAELMRAAREQAQKWRPWFCPNVLCDGKPHDDWQWKHCRADQRPPAGDDWFVWLLRSGRGAGKTRAGAEWTRQMTSITGRIALIARTTADIRETVVEGESGILATSPPNNYPEWEPSKRRITWPNGCIGNTYSAEEPDRLRGPQHGAAWGDEPAHWDQVSEVWDNLLLGLRLGRHPRICATTTPKPIKWLIELVKDPLTVDVKTSTYENLDNLAETFKRTVLDRYEGTRTGKQELYGDILEDVEGSLWKITMIDPYRLRNVDPREVARQMERIVVAIDPAGTSNKRSDETGIVVLGKRGGELFVLADYSGKYSPHGWATRANNAAQEFLADAVVAEKNFGGDMVRTTLQTAGVTVRIKLVHSRRGKAIRAEPIVGIYEQERAHHVGMLEDLETEQVSWVPGEGDSPNRVDALVHGATDLLIGAGTSDIASPVGQNVSAPSMAGAGLTVGAGATGAHLGIWRPPVPGLNYPFGIRPGG